MIRWFLMLLALATPSQAETARVLSGEHGDFTRLVIEMPAPADWIVGRTPDGYAFAAKMDEQPEYDLSVVWQKIRRNRLASLEVDQATGALSLGLACDCHVFPFEYGSGIIVLDIKEGPAPSGSAFEAAFATSRPASQPASASGGYDWITAFEPQETRRSTDFRLPLDTGAISLKPLRDELLEQLAKGAADGVVDMELPGKPRGGAETETVGLPWSNIRIGEQPGVVVTNPGALIDDETATADCAPADLLDLSSWGEGRLPRDLLAESRIGLFGEFDAPDEDAILRSTRQLLYLGFGVEARQSIDFLGPEAESQAVALYRSMGRLVDGEIDPQTPFAQMLDCDGPAALWAALAFDRFPAGPSVNRDAILQAYQALPSHLRRHLGPGLAERFLAREDTDAARMIRDAIERAPDADPGSVALLDAKANLQAGDIEAAQSHAETAVSLDGDSVENLIALVETHFLKLEPITPEIADALSGLRSETDATSIGPNLDRAIVLALALSDQSQAAFEEPAAATHSSDLWQVISARAADDDFLGHAVLSASAPQPEVKPAVGRAVAERLLALGFPDAALMWLGPVTPMDPADLRLTAANAELQRGDAQKVIALLADIDDPAAEALRAKALLQIGDVAAAQAALAAAGEAEAAARAELWKGDWASLDPTAPETWRLAAEQALPLPPDDAVGPLGRGDNSIEASLASREAIEALLESVPSPSAN
jgi:hypothetical protein